MNVSMPPEALSMPSPRVELICRVAGGPDVGAFLWSGRESVRELKRTLAIADRTLESFESILDFGCGCGRMLLWLEDIGKASALYGTDIDADAVAWCREHIPHARMSVNDADPPLPFDNGAFDLVFNHSVFTHIDERRQDMWLTELKRVTRPGGLLVLTVHGEVAVDKNEWAVRERLERDGIAFMDKSLSPGFPLPDWYQTTCHAPWYVFEHWGRWFEIRAYLPRAALNLQDHVVLERRPGDAPVRTPVAARPHEVQAGPDRRVAAALGAAERRRRTSVDADSPSRFGALGKLARRLAPAATRP